MNANDVFALGLRPSRWRFWIRTGIFLTGMLLLAAWIVQRQSNARGIDDGTLVRAERRAFKRTLVRDGSIQPVREERIFAKLAGTILDIAPEGTLAKKGDIVLKLDAVPHEDAKAEQEELMAEAEAEYKKNREESLKALNLAREDVKSYDLRLELEQMRLDEIKKGPTPADEINAKVNLENNQNLYNAKKEESAAITGLAKLGYAAAEEQRQKELETAEQNLKVVEMDIAHRKLNLIDAVKVGDQYLKVKEAAKTRDGAKEKVIILERTIARDDERYKLKRDRNEERLKELIADLEKTVYRAPCDGVIVPRRTKWGMRFAPGREVYDGMEVVTIPDLSQMKVRLTVAEGSIGRVRTGMPASITPAGWRGEALKGTVTKIAEQGLDEFESFQDDTIAISGSANRKVFEVEIELQNHSRELRLGLRCNVEIVMEQIDDAIVVPRAALIRQKDGDVFASILKPADGGVEKRKITVRAESDLWAAVNDIKDGERLVIGTGL